MLIGDMSGWIGGEVGALGMPFAQTASIVASSTVNSAGMYALSGGESDFTTSFGAFSVNWSKGGEISSLGGKGNSKLENISYGFGALANLQDAVALNMGGDVEANSLKDPIGHFSLRSQGATGGIPSDVDISKGTLDGKLLWGKSKYWPTQPDSELFPKIVIRNINIRLLKWMTDNIHANKDLLNITTANYGLIGNTCSSQAARALWFVGVPNLGGLLGPHFYIYNLR